MSGRYNQVTRMLRISSLIEGSADGLTIAELYDRIKDDFPVDKRSVYRDVQALGDCGFAIYEEVDPSDKRIVRWKMDRTVKAGKTLVLAPRELVGLFLARSALTPLTDTPFFEDLERAYQKIESILGEKSTEYLREVASGIHFEPGPRWGLGIDPDVIETVRACCEERQLLSVIYQSQNSGETKRRTLGAHFFYFAQGSVYLVAEDIDAGRVKVFSVPRMSEPQMLDEVYHGEPVDPNRFFESSIGVFQGGESVDVKLLIAPPLASYVRERRWHHSQTVVNLDNGGLRLSLHVAQSPELLNWILSFGANVRVEEPRELAEQVAGAAAEIVEMYKGRKSA